MSSAVILTWMEISFVFITVVFCFGSLVRKVSKSSGPGEQLLECFMEWRKKSAPSWTLAGTEESFGVCVWNAIVFCLFLFDLLGVPLKSVILVFLFLFVLSLFHRHVLNMHAPRPHTMD